MDPILIDDDEVDMVVIGDESNTENVKSTNKTEKQETTPAINKHTENSEEVIIIDNKDKNTTILLEGGCNSMEDKLTYEIEIQCPVLNQNIIPTKSSQTEHDTGVIIIDDKEKNATNLESMGDSENNKSISNKNKINRPEVKPETIPNSQSEINQDVIIIDDKETNTTTNDDEAFKISLKNNRLLDKIVTLCLKCSGMPRVIHKTLLPLYVDADVRYKQSESFRDLLKKTYRLLIRDPNHKFLHIKTLCEGLKSGLKKKVPFVTLATNLQHSKNQVDLNLETSSRNNFDTTIQTVVDNIVINNFKTQEKSCDRRNIDKRKPKNSNQKTSKERYSARSIKRKRKYFSPVQIETRDIIKRNKITKGCKVNENEIIDLDSSDESVCGHNEVSVSDNKTRHERAFSKEKENTLGENSVHVLDESTHDSNKSNKENNLSSETNANDIEHIEVEEGSEHEEFYKKTDVSDKLATDFEHLIPKSQIEIVFDEGPGYDPSNKVIELEKEMEFYKKKIEILEAAEVNSDSAIHSPYIHCAKYKSKIVECYKKICEIMGNEENLVKRREIRLNVAEGHPPGPAKRLETFLNLNIDKNTGTVPFPDFVDVMDCVLIANRTDNLGWSNERALQEATMLFTECGMVLRQSRQKREFKDLLGFVKKKELVDDDPADKDPELFAKLELNKQLAKAKEEEILERYVHMQNNSAVLHSRLVTIENASISDSSDEDNTSKSVSETAQCMSNTAEPTKTILRESSQNNETTVTCTESSNSKVQESTISDHTREDLGSSEILVRNESCNLNVDSVTYNNDNHIKNLETVLNESCKVSENFNSCNNLSVNSVPNVINNDKVSKEVENLEIINDTSNVPSVSNDGDNNFTNREGTEIKVKTEPIDIQSMFDQLGDNFVCSIYGIEDPFLVIEISSESSSEDET